MKITQVRETIKNINEDAIITKTHDVCGGVAYEVTIFGEVVYTFIMKSGKSITHVAWAELCEAIEGHQVVDPNEAVIEAIGEAIEGDIVVELACDLGYGKKYNVYHNGDLVGTYMLGKMCQNITQDDINEIIAGIKLVIEGKDDVNSYEGLTPKEIKKIEKQDQAFAQSECNRKRHQAIQEANYYEMRSFNLAEVSKEIFDHFKDLEVDQGVVIRHLRGRHAEDTLQKYNVLFEGHHITTFVLCRTHMGDEHTICGTVVDRIKNDITKRIFDYLY